MYLEKEGVMKQKLTEIILAGFFTLIGVLLGTTLNDTLSRYQWRTETRFEIYSELTLELSKFTVLKSMFPEIYKDRLYQEMSDEEIEKIRSLIARALLVAGPELEKELLLLDIATSFQEKRLCEGGWCPSNQETAADFFEGAARVFSLMQVELR